MSGRVAIAVFFPPGEPAIVRGLARAPRLGLPGLEIPSVKAELEKLGRFAEPALRYTIGQTSDAATRERLEAAIAVLQPAD